jgi:anti-anti-sigma factor
MNRMNETVGNRVSPLQHSLAVARGPCAENVCVLHLDGAFRAPLNGVLPYRVQVLLGRGKQTIVLDLARVWSIDAAGVGQLVRLYNLTMAADGVLRIAHVTTWVRELLQRAALFSLLTAGGD